VHRDKSAAVRRYAVSRTLQAESTDPARRLMTVCVKRRAEFAAELSVPPSRQAGRPRPRALHHKYDEIFWNKFTLSGS